MVDLPGLELQAIDVRDTRFVGEEDHEPPVGREGGVDVLALQIRQLLDLTRGQVVEGELVVAEVQPAQVAVETVGDENELRPVRRELGLEIRVRVVRQTYGLLGLDVVQPQVREAALHG